MKKFIKYFFVGYMLLAIVVMAQGGVMHEMAGAFGFAVAFLGWLLLVTVKGSRTVKI